jgi:NADPH:quinone reductase-like Zn-dependent oxidoreductase
MALLALLSTSVAASERSVLTYGHTWRRSEQTLSTFLSAMRNASAAGVVQSVAVEALSVHPNNGSLYVLETGSAATPLAAVVAELKRMNLAPWGWLLNVEPITCADLRPVWTSSLAQDAVQAAVRAGYSGLVVDLEPGTEHAPSDCTAADGAAFERFLRQLTSEARTAGLETLVYAERWEAHGVHTLFNYSADALASDGCLIGLTYDGVPPIPPLDDFMARLNYSTRAVADASRRWIGLTTDSAYDGAAIGARIDAAAAAGATRLHVFTDAVPASWVAPLQAFLEAARSPKAVVEPQHRERIAARVGGGRAAGGAPPTMRAVRKVGATGCGPPDFSCVAVESDARTPVPRHGEVLIKVAGSGLNPDELTPLKLPGVSYTLGIDVAGTVATLGEGCSGRLRVGDTVWAPGVHGGWAEWAVRPEKECGLLPPSVDAVAAGTLPTVAMTDYGALRAAGAPWAAGANATVLITAGTGGTGYVAVQLARALGAATVVTAATGDGIEFARALGADVVVDYERASVYDAVADRSLRAVLSNHKSNTTAARAMPKLAAGGVYVTLDEDTVAHPPPGVTCVSYDMFDPAEVARWPAYLDALGDFLADGTLQMHVQRSFGFEEAAEALGVMAQGHVRSKLAVAPSL